MLVRFALLSPAASTGVIGLFTLLWSCLATANMLAGVVRASYSFSEEFPLLLLILFPLSFCNSG